MPHQVLADSTGRQFIATEFNREGDSFRSPFTNQYYPPVEDGYQPSESSRQLESKGNELFQEYTMLYYDSAVSSFFVLDQDYGFDCAFFVRKELAQEEALQSGLWHSFNTCVVRVDRATSTASYRLKSTVLVELHLEEGRLGTLRVNGFLEHASERKEALGTDPEATHLEVIGQMVEAAETHLRKELENMEAEKTREILLNLRTQAPIVEEELSKGKAMQMFKLPQR